MRAFTRTVCFLLLLIAAASGGLLVLHRPAPVPTPPARRRTVRRSAAPSLPRLSVLHAVGLPPQHLSPELIVLRKGWLCVGSISSAGVPSGRLRRIRRVRADGVESLEASPDGNWAAVEDRGPGDRQWTVLLLALRRRGPEIRLTGAFQPAFSPDGRTLAFSHGIDSLFNAEVCLLDLRTDRRRVLQAYAEGACWLRDGRSVALADYGADPGDDPQYEIVDVGSGRVMDRFYPGVSPLRPIVSPDGRFVGVCHKISRPQVGSFVFDRKTRGFADIGCDIGGYNPALLTAWSPDGSRLLWDLTVPDPDNDGSNLGDTVAVSALRGSQQRLFGRGRQAHFAPDGRHILWIDGWSWPEPRAGRLLWCSLGGRPRRLLPDVTAFDIIGSPPTHRRSRRVRVRLPALMERACDG